MEAKAPTHHVLTLCAALLILSTLSSQLSPLLAQGSLTPLGAPAPTMKTLDQVESRTIVNATNTPGNSSYSFVISQPGSYYLTGNFTAVDSKGGINVTAADVTLDLNGYTLSGGSSSTGAGISLPSGSVDSVTIRNGKVISWGTDGILASSSARMAVENIHAQNNGRNGSNTGAGMFVGQQSHVRHCSAIGNSRGGIEAGDGTSVSDCEAANNQSYGISISDGIVSRCTLVANGINVVNDGIITDCRVSSGGISALGSTISVAGCTVVSNGVGNGIKTGGNATIEHCSVSSSIGDGISSGAGSTLRGCSARANAGNGIVLGDHSTAQDCVSSGNTGDGITVTVECSVLNCNACANTGNGIHLLGGANSNNRVDGNNASNNTAIGILQHAGPDLIVRNVARSNGSGTNYSPSSGTSVGPIGTPNTATSPWANFQ
jgi:hypothetical protein